MDLIIAAWDIYIQQEHVVCKGKKKGTKQSFSVNQHVWLSLTISGQTGFGALHVRGVSDLSAQLQPLSTRIWSAVQQHIMQPDTPFMPLS